MKYSLAQWRHDYMAPGRADDSETARGGDPGVALGVVAVLVWLVAMAIEFLLLGGLRSDAARIMFQATEVITAVPFVNIVVQLILLFGARSDRVPVLQLTSLLLAVPWMAIVIVKLGGLGMVRPATAVIGGP